MPIRFQLILCSALIVFRKISLYCMCLEDRAFPSSFHHLCHSSFWRDEESTTSRIPQSHNLTISSIISSMIVPVSCIPHRKSWATSEECRQNLRRFPEQRHQRRRERPSKASMTFLLKWNSAYTRISKSYRIHSPCQSQSQSQSLRTFKIL